MTTDERLTIIESAVVQLIDSLRQLADTTAEHHFELAEHRQTLARQNEEIARHSEAMVAIVETLARHDQRHEDFRESMEEYRREASQMQRLWVHLARKNGWLEDEDWPPPENP